MTKIYERFEKFFNNKDEHVLLLKGNWGVGKSFTVNQWLRKKLEKNIDLKIVDLCLFGVKDSNELLSQLLSKTDLKHNVKQFIKKFKVGTSINLGLVKLELPINLLFSFIIKEEFKDNKNCVIVIDDIERKDNKLNIEEILGFIENLKINKCKVILIANVEWLNQQGEEHFDRFKEKIIDKEILIDKPSREVKKMVVDNENIFKNCLIDRTDNLRTLKKLKKISEENNIVNEEKLNAVLLALECVNNGKYRRDEFIKKKINETIGIRSISNNNVDEKSIHDEIEKEYSKEKYKDKDVFVNFVCNNEEFKLVDKNNIKELLETSFNCVIKDDYKDIVNHEIKYKEKYSGPAISSSDLFYSSNPYILIEKHLNEIYKNIDSFHGELFPLFKEVIQLGYYSNTYLKQNEKYLNLYENVKNKLMDDVIQEIIITNESFKEYFDSFYYPFFNEKYENEFKKIKEEIVNKIEISFVDYYIKNDFDNIIEKYNNIKNAFSSFDLQNNKESLLILIDKIIDNINKQLLFDINRKIWSRARELFEWFNNFENIKLDIIGIVDRYIDSGNENQKMKLTILKNVLIKRG